MKATDLVASVGTTKSKRDVLRDLLLQSDAAVEKAIVRIYERQTADEQAGEYTEHTNGVGYSKYDAEIMCSLAKQILINYHRNRPGFILSIRQLEVGRKKILRYTRQLLEIATEKAKAEQASNPAEARYRATLAAFTERLSPR